jgi:hypothetical protein
MAWRGWLVIAMGVCSLRFGMACGDDHRPGTVRDEGPRPGGSGGGGRGGHGGRDMSPANIPTKLPLIEGFAPGTFCEGDNWCWYNPTPVGTGWLAAADAGPQDIWIAGTGSNGLHFDGRAWSVFESPLLRTTGIWAASRNDIWMVGSLPPLSPELGPRSGIAHSDGQTVDIVFEADDSSFYQAIWGSGPNDVWAVGLGGNVAHFDGQTWTKQTVVAGSSLVGGWTIDGSGPDDVWVGEPSGLFHFDGTTWTQVTELGSQFVLSIAVRARNDVWMSAGPVGTNTIYHYDGTTWTPTLTRPFGQGLILDIDARTPNDAWAVGAHGVDDIPNGVAGFLLHWDGTTWTPAPDVPVGLDAVLSLPASHIVVGDAGHVFQLSTDPVPAVRDLNPSAVPALQGIWGSSPSDMWAVGSSGSALHYDGSTVRQEVTGVSSLLLDVWGTAPDDIWAVGERGIALRRSSPIAGASSPWTPVPTGTTATLRAVFAAARDDVWIGGDGGLFHSDGVVVSPVAVPGLSAMGIVHDIHGLAPDDIWASGEDSFRAFVSHYDGTSWSPIQIVDDRSVGVARIWMVAPNDVWGDITIEARDPGPGNTWHFDGTAWTPRFLAPAADRWMFPDPDLDNGLSFPQSSASFSFSRDDVWAAWHLGSIARRRMP